MRTPTTAGSDKYQLGATAARHSLRVTTPRTSAQTGAVPARAALICERPLTACIVSHEIVLEGKRLRTHLLGHSVDGGKGVSYRTPAKPILEQFLRPPLDKGFQTSNEAERTWRTRSQARKRAHRDDTVKLRKQCRIQEFLLQQLELRRSEVTEKWHWAMFLRDCISD